MNKALIDFFACETLFEVFYLFDDRILLVSFSIDIQRNVPLVKGSFDCFQVEIYPILELIRVKSLLL